MLALESDMTLVGEASNNREVIKQFRTHAPDSKLMALLISHVADPRFCVLLATLGATLAMIGPSAWSIDARFWAEKKSGCELPPPIGGVIPPDLMSTFR
jgi:hypothetical protein